MRDVHAVVSIGRPPRLPIDALVPLLLATIGLITLPLMVFHMIRLLVCAVIAGQLAREVSYG